MKFFIKVGTGKNGKKYRALGMRRGEISRTLTFDIEAILLALNITLEELLMLPEGIYEI